MGNKRQGVALFFVDKDLSDILNENWTKAHNIFVTDFYSIENYLVTKDMFYRVWTELFHFTEQPINLNESILTKFEEELDKFYRFMLPLIAWGICLRRRRVRPNLKNINFSDFFVFTDDIKLEKSKKAMLQGEFKLLEAICGTQTPPNSQQEIDDIIGELTLLPPKEVISGKLELSFFIAFVYELTKRLNEELASISDKVRVLMKTQINKHNALEILGPRIEIPDSLKEFLQKNLSVN